MAINWGGSSARAIRAQLAKIVASEGFAHSDHRKRLLGFLVEKTLKGEEDQIKEYLLGVEALSRPASFDPQSDPIVRVEAKRLRQKLEAYYLAEGKDDPILITIPAGRYSPVFSRRRSWPRQFLRSVRWPNVGHRWIYLAAIALPVAIMLFAFSPTADAPGLERGADDLKTRQAEFARTCHSLLVLPFVDLNRQNNGSELADGLTEEVIAATSHLDGVSVIARTTAFRFKNHVEDVRDIGARLHVAFVLEGSLRRVDGRVRIITQLISTTDGLSLWSGTFEQQENQSAGWTEAVAQEITASLESQLKELIPTAIDPPRASDIRAHDEYLRGQYDASRGGQVGLEASLLHFQEAIRTSPTYAPPYAQLASTYCMLGLYGALPPEEVLAKARVAAFKAVSLDHRLGLGYAALGFVNACYLWNFPAAEQAFGRALELAPKDPEVMQQFVLAYLIPQGRLDESLDRLQHLMAIRPASVFTRELLLETYFYRREYKQVLAHTVGEDVAHPGAASMNLPIGLAWEQISHFDDAVEAFQRAGGAWNPGLKYSSLAHAYATKGDAANARKLIADLKNPPAGDYVPRSYLALPYIGLGENQQALACLEKAAEEHCPSLVLLRVDPRYDPLRSDPRFIKLIKKIGL